MNTTRSDHYLRQVTLLSVEVRFKKLNLAAGRVVVCETGVMITWEDIEDLNYIGNGGVVGKRSF